MSLAVPSLSEYRYRLSTTTGQPVPAFGTVVTPGTNTMGAWAQLIAGASVLEDIWMWVLNINSNVVNVQIRDTLIDVGIDPAGGTTYTVLATNLLLGGAEGHELGGVRYVFPVHIPAGASIAVRASVNNVIPGTLRAWMRLYGLPKNPEVTKVGTFIRSFGATTASSSGTAITPGTTSEGAWQLLGTTADRLWWWQVGLTAADLTMSNSIHHVDLSSGDGSLQKILIENMPIVARSSEGFIAPTWAHEAYGEVASGIGIYGRIQCTSVNDATSMMAYGVGG